jgi:hypothetical protein
MNLDIKYYKDINTQEFSKLQLWFVDFIKKNKRDLLYSKVVLVELLEYKIIMTMEMNANVTVKLVKNEETLAFELVTAPLYNRADKAFMSLLILLKKFRQRCTE